MSTVPFKCAKSGAAFTPEQGFQCAACGRLLLLDYLRPGVMGGEAVPVCADCATAQPGLLAPLADKGAARRWIERFLGR